jgi:glycosyltransferase involved in cell wall biosynthesis
LRRHEDVPIQPVAGICSVKRERTPTVSIITAAYNRSNVLRYAIASVIRSTVTDWELLVVGDACTDDTADVVASFKDHRISFINLETNTGEQSGPNNEGFRHARGRYISYLNQDDLWLPDHLEKTMEAIQSSGADGVFSLGIVSMREGQTVLQGVMPNGCYDPVYGRGAAATQWLLRREMLEELGGWRHFRGIHLPPSQDLLFRAWKTGKRLVMVPFVTAILIPSGFRNNAYANLDFDENERYFNRICTEQDFRERELLNLAIRREEEVILESFGIKRGADRLFRTLLKRAGLLIGIFPQELFYRLRYGKKGGVIDMLRKRRGLSAK